MDTLLRYLEMLRLIPKEPQSISTTELFEKLQNNGYDVELRTVQRDLIKLSASHLFPICSTENKKPQRWFWQKDMNRVQFPMMSADEALTFKLVEQFLEPLLPLAVKTQIDNYFQVADETLKISPFATWIEKVRIVPNGLALLPARVPEEILMVIYDALFKNRRISATYQGYEQAKSYEVNPLGLVLRHNLMYLVGTVGEHKNIKQFALHRFQKAQLSEHGVSMPNGFNLDDYIAQGEFDYPVGEKIVLKLKIQAFIGSTHETHE